MIDMSVFFPFSLICASLITSGVYFISMDNKKIGALLLFFGLWTALLSIAWMFDTISGQVNFLSDIITL